MKKKTKKKSRSEFYLKDLIEREIKNNELRNNFSDKMIKISEEISNRKLLNHKDFTHIPFITIDGEDSKDFDDAVWSEERKGYFKIMIAISDVSFYVDEDSILDIEARKRGNSFYFPDRVIPMFPQKLSNDTCSIVPKKERACIVIEINLLTNGEIESFKIHRAKIKSQARFSYNEVDEIYKNNIKNPFLPLVKCLYKTFYLLEKKSKKRGKINFELEEYNLKIFNDKKFIFEKKKNLDSYKLIEELMILANTVVANLLITKKADAIFRNHEKPKKEKVLELKTLLKEYNLNSLFSFNSQDDFNQAITMSKNLNYNFLNDSLVRCQSKAFYQNLNKGHFGLALKNYTHFTSPIRRYSDLVVHRSLLKVISNKKKNFIEKNLSDHLTFQEKKADSIERSLIEKACSIFLLQLKRKSFYGIIDGVESFGIFIKCKDYPFSALARLKQRKRSFAKTNKEINSNFKLGQLVSFRIKKNNVFNGKILADEVRIIND